MSIFKIKFNLDRVSHKNRKYQVIYINLTSNFNTIQNIIFDKETIHIVNNINFLM